ncbi:MAG: phytase, partial [Roseiflexaceae bacterium]
MRPHPRNAFIGAIIVLLLSGCASATPATIRDQAASITASIETEPMPHAGDAADDPAIWVNP